MTLHNEKCSLECWFLEARAVCNVNSHGGWGNSIEMAIVGCNSILALSVAGLYIVQTWWEGNNVAAVAATGTVSKAYRQTSAFGRLHCQLIATTHTPDTGLQV